MSAVITRRDSVQYYGYRIFNFSLLDVIVLGAASR